MRFVTGFVLGLLLVVILTAVVSILNPSLFTEQRIESWESRSISASGVLAREMTVPPYHAKLEEMLRAKDNHILRITLTPSLANASESAPSPFAIIGEYDEDRMQFDRISIFEPASDACYFGVLVDMEWKARFERGKLDSGETFSNATLFRIRRILQNALDTIGRPVSQEMRDLLLKK